MNNNFTVYMHITPDNKKYIGITSRGIKKRGSSGYGYKNNKYFFNAIQKYGWDNIEHVIFAENLSKSDACELEIYLIDKYKSHNREFGYNLSLGGEVNHGWHHDTSDETRQRISQAIKEWHKRPDVKEKLKYINVGRKVSDETRRKLSESHIGNVSGMKGKKHSIESRIKMSESHKKSKSIMSDEGRRRVSEAAKNRVITDETREKLRQSRLGKKMSDETKLKLSNIKKGRHLTDEQKRKISESLRQHYANKEYT